MKFNVLNKIQNFFITTKRLQTIWRYVSIVISSLHIILTLIILMGAFVYVAHFNFSLNASDLGSFLSGVSSSLAFIWLIKGMQIQSENLRLQRIALETQAKELSTNAKFASISQIENILNRANQILIESNLNISKPAEISSLFFTGMTRWKSILESSSPDVVMTQYQEWVKIEGTARQYLACVSQALRLYLDHNTNVKYDLKSSDENFIYVYSPWGNKVPFLSNHLNPATIIAQELFSCEPALESMKVASMYALTKSTRVKCFKDGFLNEMKENLVSKGYHIPAIAKD